MPPPGPLGVPGAWRLALADDFDGPGIDPARWLSNRWGGDGLEPPFNPEDEGACYSPGNVSVAGSCVVLTVHAEANVLHGVAYSHTSGMLSSSGRFTVQEGDLLEARVWVPRGAGLWPAFWTVPEDRWPPETDVFEFFDTDRQARPMFNHHPSEGRQTGPVAYGDPDVDHRESWHVYGLLRSGGRLLPFVDGSAAEDAATACDPADPPMSVVLDLAVYRGSRPPEGASMAVDWVRLWRPLVGDPSSRADR